LNIANGNGDTRYDWLRRLKVVTQGEMLGDIVLIRFCSV